MTYVFEEMLISFGLIIEKGWRLHVGLGKLAVRSGVAAASHLSQSRDNSTP